MLGIYFKYMFFSDYNLKHNYAKILFNKYFPNINLKNKQIDSYIFGKYRKKKY